VLPLLNGTKFNPKHIEKIPAKPRNPAHRGILPFKVSIASSKEALVQEDQNTQELIKIYSDSSAHKGKVGAAAVLTRPGKLHQILHFHLGPENEHMVPKAELIGIILALNLIKTEKKKSTSIAIGTDNQATIEAFQTNLRNAVHNAAREILCLGNMLQKQTHGKSFALMLQWMAGHVGIPGNELADKEAKRAAGGLCLDKNLLPLYLKCGLTINPSAVQRSHSEELKQNWKCRWRESK
jgi:ribonuclease HI